MDIRKIEIVRRTRVGSKAATIGDVFQVPKEISLSDAVLLINLKKAKDISEASETQQLDADAAAVKELEEAAQAQAKAAEETQEAAAAMQKAAKEKSDKKAAETKK